jgi:hypothetical protein
MIMPWHQARPNQRAKAAEMTPGHLRLRDPIKVGNKADSPPFRIAQRMTRTVAGSPLPFRRQLIEPPGWRISEPMENPAAR